MNANLVTLKLELEPNADAITKHYGFRNKRTFMLRFTTDISISRISGVLESKRGRIIFEAPKVRKPEPNQELISRRSRQNKISERPLVLINGEPGDQYDYIFATCCNPVMGGRHFCLCRYQQWCENPPYIMPKCSRYDDQFWISNPQC